MTQGRAQGRAQTAAGPAQATMMLVLGAYDCDSDDEGTRPNSAAEEHEATIDAASVRELALVIPLAMERGGELLTDL